MTPGVILRCDAGPGVGGGHLRRCLALADALAARGLSAGFAVGSDVADDVKNTVEAAGHRLATVSAREAEARDAILQLGTPLLVVLDHYRRDAVDEALWKGEGTMVVAIDDVPERPHAVDVLVDPAGGHSEADWQAVAPAARVCADTRFAFVRSEIARARPSATSRDRSAPVRSISIGFGLSDRADAASATLRAVVGVVAGEDIDVEVIVGRDRVTSALAALACGHSRVAIVTEPDDYPERLSRADIVIGAGGVSALERACLGVPSIAIETAANQRGTLRRLSNAGATIDLGALGAGALGRLAPALRLLIDDAGERQKLARNGAMLVDGGGCERVADLLVSAMRRVAA